MILRSIRTLAPASASLLLLLAACSDDEILPGERFPVRSVDEVRVAEDVAAGALPAPEANDAWAQRGGSAGRSGFHPAFPGTRSVVWRYSAPRGASDDWPASIEPVVAEERVFLLDGATELHAVDRDSGRAVWRRSLRPEDEEGLDGIRGGLAHAGGRLVVTTGYGEVIALDAADGAELWRRSLPAPAHAAPVIEAGRVALISRDDRLLALDVRTGDLLWEARGAGAETVYLEAPAPAVQDGIVVVPFASGELGAYSLAGGESLWRRILASGEADSPLALFRDLTSDPVIGGDLVFAGTRHGEFGAFSWQTGDVVWRLPVGSPAPAWAAGDSVYLVDSNARLSRVHAGDGTILWQRQLQAFEDPEDLDDPIYYTGPVLAGGQVLLGSTDERLLAFDAVSGAPAWELPLGAALLIPPVVAAETAFLFLADGTLVAMR